MTDSDSIEQRIRQTLYDTLESSPQRSAISFETAADADLIQAGIDSLDMIEVFLRLESTFGAEIPATEYGRLRSIKALEQHLADGQRPGTAAGPAS